jgi:hypothetical protein
MNTTVHQFPYTHERWERLLSQTTDAIRQLAAQKGGEYAGDADRLANFRRNGAELGLEPEQVWRVYAGKHWDAITQWVKDTSEGKTRPRMESVAGRCDDLIVYLILLKAMVEVREPKTPGESPLETSLPLEKVCQHEWRRYDRYTDMCIFCNSMREHRR